MPELWQTVWATGHDIPRIGGLVRTGAVVSMCSGGSDRRPLVAVVAGLSPADDVGDRLCLWDLTTGVLKTVPVVAARCVAMGVSADGPVAVTGHADGALRVWALPEGQLLRTWNNGASVDDIQASGPGGDVVVVTLDADGVVARWSLETGLALGTVGASGSRAICAGQLTCGRQIVVSAGAGLALWDAHSGEQLPLPTVERKDSGIFVAVTLSVLEGRDCLTVVTESRELVTVDVATGHQIGEVIDSHADDFMPLRARVWGGRRARPTPAVVDGVLAVPTKWRVHLWDLPSSVSRRPALSGPVQRPMLGSVRWNGQDWLLTGSAEDGMVVLWDLSPSKRQLIGHQEQVGHLAVASGVVVSADDGGAIAARRIDDGAQLTEPTRTDVQGIVALVAWPEEGTIMAAIGAGSANCPRPWLQRWDLVARREIRPRIELDSSQVRNLGLAVVRGQTVLVVVDKFLLQLRRPSDGRLLQEVPRLSRAAQLVVGPSDGGPIAILSLRGEAPEVYRLEELEAAPTVIPSLRGSFVAAMDDTRLISGSYEERRSEGWRTVRTCNLSGDPLGPDVVGAPISAVAVAAWPAVYIARTDGTICLTDLVSGRDLCPPLQLPAPARSIAAADDGDLLVGSGIDVARFKPPINDRM